MLIRKAALFIYRFYRVSSDYIIFGAGSGIFCINDDEHGIWKIVSFNGMMFYGCENCTYMCMGYQR